MSYAPLRPLTYNYGVGTAFGAVSGFNGAATWNDWLAGANGNNAAGMRAADAIRAALGGIGYGPFTVGVAWGTSADKAGFSKFVSDNGLTAGPNGSWWPTQQSILKLEEAANQGGNQGGGTIQSFHVVDGQQIPGASPASKAAMTGTTIGLLVGGALILGFLAYRAKKKDTRSGGGYGDGTGPGYMLGPGTTTRYAANRSRRRARYAANGRTRGPVRAGLVLEGSGGNLMVVTRRAPQSGRWNVRSLYQKRARGPFVRGPYGTTMTGHRIRGHKWIGTMSTAKSASFKLVR